MRAELPWNVAGIPPEARDAARAAARREGLSVGEWLTRRILRSFSGVEEEIPPFNGHESRAPGGAPLDSWGLPPSAAARRDTEEMMARVGRSETESNDAWHRIEEQLRGLGRRVDSSERSHSESNRALSRTTQEINISAREQAQAFDQLGMNVMAVQDRIDRLEHASANDGTKEAVKALHAGLSRLADQITSTANNSATQVAQLATSMEQLAGHVTEARDNVETSLINAEANILALDEKLQVTADAIDQRLASNTAATTSALDQRLQQASAALEQRLAASEKTTNFNTNALDHALEKLEASISQRASDQVEQQHRAAQTEESINRLEDAIARLEMRLPDQQIETRLDGIERTVSYMADRLEQHDPAQTLEPAVQALTHRLEALEKNHDRLEQHDPAEKLEPAMQALTHRLESLEKDHGDLVQAILELRARPTVEPQHTPAHEPPAHEAPAFNPEPPPADHDYAAPYPGFAPPAHDAFAPPTPGGFHFDIPQEGDAFTQPTDFGPEFQDLFEPTPEPENFLSQARRKANAAAENPAETRSRFSLFNRGQATNENAAEDKARPRYVIPLAIALIAVVAVVAGLVLMNRAKTPVASEPVAAKPAAPTPSPIYTVPAPSQSGGARLNVAPAAGGDASDTRTLRSEPGVSESPSHTVTPLQPHALQQQAVRNAPVKAVPNGGKAAAPSADRVLQLANAGNPSALTILGLRALDGTNGQPVNLADAVKYLTQAALKGQAVAQYRLGTLYERGQAVTADGVQAAHWYELAAAQGNRKAMHNLAVAYASGIAGKKNMTEAARWFAKAAGLGLSDSQFNLAVLYERGDGVPQSLVEAYKWYAIAGAQGDNESKSRIAALQTQLNDSDKATANRSAVSFHAAPLNRSANVPPEVADLAGQ